MPSRDRTSSPCHGPLSDRLSGARTVRASAHQTAARQTCSGLSSQDFDNLLGSTAAEFFALPGGLKKKFYAPRRHSSKLARAGARKSPGAIGTVEPAGY